MDVAQVAIMVVMGAVQLPAEMIAKFLATVIVHKAVTGIIDYA